MKPPFLGDPNRKLGRKPNPKLNEGVSAEVFSALFLGVCGGAETVITSDLRGDSDMF